MRDFIFILNSRLRQFKEIIRFVGLLLIIISVVLLVRIFIVDFYMIPSNSMYNTLKEGDWILVNKLSYGPRLWFKSKGGVSRCLPTGQINYNDIIVFNFPCEDSIFKNRPDINFQNHLMRKGRVRGLSDTSSFGKPVFLPIKERQPFIKRCIALPGDTFEMHLGNPYINGKMLSAPSSSITIKPHKVKNHDLTKRKYPALKDNNSDYWSSAFAFRVIFPNNYIYIWNHDIYGPIVIPKKGETVALNFSNIWLYKRIIEVYEHNKLVINDEGIFINGRFANLYTFKMNYYFMLGDNRPSSIDSIYWGFVPEDHIIGKAVMTLFSFGTGTSGENSIQWERILKKIK